MLRPLRSRPTTALRGTLAHAARSFARFLLRGSPALAARSLAGFAPLLVARRLARNLGAALSRTGYLRRWVVLATLIGVIAGFGAIAFYEALRLATHELLGALAAYRVPTPAGEGGLPGSPHYLRPWAIPLVVMLGGALSGALVFTFAPEAEGHGTDAAIDAVHNNPRGIRLRAVIVKIIASALTIGSGGSGGREGPTAQISAGFGSLLARVLDLSPEDGRIAVSVGIGSGIGAIFSAPLGGAVLAADIVYREDFEFKALIPGLLASFVAYAIFGGFEGYQPLFAFGAGYTFDARQLPWFAIIGLLAGGVGLLYTKTFYAVAAVNRRLPLPRFLRPALGGLLVGLIALALPEVLGTGYGWVQKGLSNELLRTPLYVILLLPIARILATALSIATGGSGGVFGPGMVIGSFTGLAVWRLFEPLAASVGADPAPYVVVGMMAVFGGISRAPLAIMIMVAEMTSTASTLVPALVAVALSTFIVSRADDSIYRSQLRNRGESPADRLRAAMPLLGALEVRRIAQPARLVLREGGPGREALEALRGAGLPGAPLIDGEGRYRGAVRALALAEKLQADPDAPVDAAADEKAMAVSGSDRVSAALDSLTQAGVRWLTVLDDRRRVVGVLSTGDIVRSYRAAVGRLLHGISADPSGSVILEESVGAGSPLVGVPLREADLPPGCIIFTIRRGDELIFPSGASTLAEGDLLTVLSDGAHRDELLALLRGPRQTKSQREELRALGGAG